MNCWTLIYKASFHVRSPTFLIDPKENIIQRPWNPVDMINYVICKQLLPRAPQEWDRKWSGSRNGASGKKHTSVIFSHHFCVKRTGYSPLNHDRTKLIRAHSHCHTSRPNKSHLRWTKAKATKDSLNFFTTTRMTLK